MLPASGSNYDLILEALQKRGGIMFEGKDGAAIRSGIDSDAASAEKPTYGLCRAAIYVVFNVTCCSTRWRSIAPAACWTGMKLSACS